MVKFYYLPLKTNRQHFHMSHMKNKAAPSGSSGHLENKGAKLRKTLVYIQSITIMCTYQYAHQVPNVSTFCRKFLTTNMRTFLDFGPIWSEIPPKFDLEMANIKQDYLGMAKMQSSKVKNVPRKSKMLNKTWKFGKKSSK